MTIGFCCPTAIFVSYWLSKVAYDASADDLLAALTALEPIYSAGVEKDLTSVLPMWHVTLVSAEAYEPIFVDGYLLEGTHASVTVSDNTSRRRILHDSSKVLGNRAAQQLAAAMEP